MNLSRVRAHVSGVCAIVGFTAIVGSIIQGQSPFIVFLLAVWSLDSFDSAMAGLFPD